MRPHRLQITAFGSFPGEEEVDFDSLAEAGLFLIHGSTGAGKTTVLDALCFALYGQVPGQRNSARSLRCDHAPPGRGPRVVLEVTIRGRRLRVTRSPAWQRPKQRGTGTTLEQAKVLLEELEPSGEWTGLTTRMDEAGDLVGGLLGMNLAQFCQVAMLPQGDFAHFLRADGEERRKVLERLFSVKVYAAAESWLADRRTAAFRDQQALRREVDSVVNRVEEAAGPGLLTALAAPAASAEHTVEHTEETRDVAAWMEDDPLGWAGALAGLAEGAAARAAAECARSGKAALEARRLLEDGVALADRRRRHAEALTRSRALQESTEERADLEAVLAEAARADRVLPLIREVEQRTEAAAKARSLAADALNRATPLLDRDPLHGGARPADLDRLTALERERLDEITRLGELRAEEPRLAALLEERGRVEAEIAHLTGEQHAADTRLAVLPGLRAGVEARLAAARLAAARLPAAEEARRAAARLAELETDLARLDARLHDLAGRETSLAEARQKLPAALGETVARLAAVRAEAAGIPAARAAVATAAAVLDAVRRRDGLTVRLEEARRTRGVAVDRAQESRDRLQEIRQSRIDGMAAELAARLVPGDPCAVCGSPDHPAPAAPADAAPTPDDERAAENAYEAALRLRQDAENEVADLASRLDETLAAAAGLTAGQAGESLAAAEREHAALAGAAAGEPRLAAEVDRLTAELEDVRAQAEEVTGLLAETRARRESAVTEQALLSPRLRADRHGTGDAREDGTAGETGEADAGSADETGEAGTGSAAGDGAAGPVALGEGPASSAGRAAQALRRAEGTLRELGESARAVPGLEAEAAGLAAELEGLRERSRELAVALSARRTNLERIIADAGLLTARLDAARGGDPTLAARLERLADEAGLLREAAEATRRERDAEDELETARARAEAGAAEAGFAGIEDARAAVRPAAEQEEKAERLRALDRERAAVDAQLADPELIAAAAEPEPDLAALKSGRDAADTAHAALLSASDRARLRRDRLAALRTELAECLDRWRPAAERHRIAEGLAALAGGNSADNQWSMRLSAYVLGERLRQVVASANERLDHMSGGRYLLQHDLRRAAGDRSRSGGGLGLRILDGWTGVDRDPATLSGGEGFITSLALALGLADVVTAEAGGVELGTLFVDEGFGTLDEDTLDGVLDILDGLRDGGRAVGIVSHVGELRTRIPARLHVRKERHGSTIRQ
ncbi:hypothetical protein Ppa06_40850 [Planomonospora parontospora subsp. parontospora]|uniref:Nuclease SbcCD subunit C n=2 Tax=Planomonospora parontospora TaxID=58119 RepID=A0AA37BJ52_9ACTN|nr:SMC family ATPase [Planomonospora parontospora]GGK78750.1 hypothetical protein GCM10010126_42700 [Planomonospora parontospora]GII10287.1 hypothetical protein Ppa06_40850 [Planomonospora parontospora subsp. parontospora]